MQSKSREPTTSRRRCISSCVSRRRRGFKCHVEDPAEIVYKDVVVIGNGPSGICLSFLLSGYWPYYVSDSHPDEFLHLRLQNEKEKSLIEQDLKFLSDGLEGRSFNPVALLFDALSNPFADLGVEAPSTLQWRHHKEEAFSHVVLGRSKEGGTWQTMEREMKTLSIGTLMQMPDFSFEKWLECHRTGVWFVQFRQTSNSDQFLNRASVDDVCQYFMDFVAAKGLKENFRNHSTVTSVHRVLDTNKTIDCENGELDFEGGDQCVWEVCGQQVTINEDGEECKGDFCYRAPNVVLATGAFDHPNLLCVPGEHQEYVLHSHTELERHIGDLTPNSDPVVIIGAGLSAADAILRARRLGIPVVHIFRRNIEEAHLVYSHLSPKLYPEYHEVYRLMQTGGTDDSYKSYPGVEILEFTPSQEVLIRYRDSNNNNSEVETVLQASFVVVLIGSAPDLTFLQDSVLKNLGVVPGVGIDGKRNPVNVDPYTYQSYLHPGLYALGPLVGDNIIRFLKGGALGITSHLWQTKNRLC